MKNALPRVEAARVRQFVEYVLTSGDALVDEHLDFYSPVLGSPRLRLIGRRRPILAHRARSNDVSHRHLTLLHEISDDGFSSVLAQCRVHRRAAGRVGIARNLNDVSLKASGGVRQLL